ncbi:hypothetical protein BN975_05369 [Mycolicibacterium farcinogenes]|nr:hypothetical protein BN975_05369 [Mycolicibacterium farcinogenes]
MQITALATAENQHPGVQFTGHGEVARVGDDLGHAAEPGRLGQIRFGQQHGHRTQPGQRRDRDQRAGPGVHQDPDPGTLAHPDVDQAAHHVVDPPIHRLVGVDPAVEQQRLTVGRAAGLLTHDAAERDAGVIVDLTQPGQARQGPRRLDDQSPGVLVRRDQRIGGRTGHPERHLGGRGGSVGDAGRERHSTLGMIRRLSLHRNDAFRHLFSAKPFHPLRHRRPGLTGSLGAHDQTEMACPDQIFVDIRIRRSPLDPADRCRLADVVDLADHCEDRAVDVRQCHQITVDGEAAGDHAVMRDELLQQFGDRRPGPRDPALRRQESALLLTWQQRFAVVQLTQELQPRLSRLDRVEHLKTGTGQPTRNVDAAEHVIGHEIRRAGGDARRQVHRQRGQGVDRRAEGDDAGQILGPPVGRRLIGEHPALRITGQVHVATGDFLDDVDRLRQRHHVIGEVALHAALDLVR